MKNAAFDKVVNQAKAKRNIELGRPSACDLAKRILGEVMDYRRVRKQGDSCGDMLCGACSSLHLPKVLAAVEKNEPVFFVLPAFPGKSPNREKVLGPLPDFAERLALQFLEGLCQRVKKYYAPGIRIILCSDGRVFSDVVGMQEGDVTAYQLELSGMIEEMSLANISTFNLDDVFGTLSFTRMREELMRRYGNSLEFLQNKIRNGAEPSASPEEQEANVMYRGITRFLFEDALFPGQTKSRTAIQKESRSKAYEVIRRSNAWSDLIADRFQAAVRLSIHPQACGSKKLGIRLIGNETWMTPWHGVAVETKSGYVLLKRSEAEAQGAELIQGPNGRASHYKLGSDRSLTGVGVEHELSDFPS